jgi:hypothetical protein
MRGERRSSRAALGRWRRIGDGWVARPSEAPGTHAAPPPLRGRPPRLRSAVGGYDDEEMTMMGKTMTGKTRMGKREG